ncbi:MAG: sigma-54 dependent transcriptional regulator [Sphingomonadaceae bacterium]|uniref:nitrogen assimilation response regulator NtrX n=1 Tax=Thermaurantiacus sp. TaxID=2820283 RepID=UPI00298F0B7B|nr:sigma-54 dependent transcriptional regulator [Thermaurantiacus sp.]MCS6985837.1 sigma-54 dependent transcriptional regulator [Sphingomonadaceae bacterium]MDW8413894.1 sigma-54 dependent transcriptional regulator [Thermaurantiacus sp.]
MPLDILVVDDEADIRGLVAGILEDEGYRARTAADSDETLAALAARRPALVILDIWLKGSRLDGLELLDEIKRTDPQLPVLIISGHGNLDTAVSAIRRGAYDFIEKPFQAEALLLAVARATETERLRREVEELRRVAAIDTELTGTSQLIHAVRATIRRVAATGSRVLISGPAGSGKETAARLLHEWSPRRQHPFVVVAAATMAPERVEEELFGREDGELKVRPGLLERADGGTLFIDEVADMPLTTQAKILRVLTDQTFQRVGGSRSIRVDVRVVSSTSRDLAHEIAAGRFREDLFYRLNVVPLRMPALADRREDIPVLAEYFLARLAAERRMRTPRLTDDAVAALQAYAWPGNVRQLRNVLERTLILAPSRELDCIDLSMLPPEITAEPTRLVPAEAARSIMAAPLREAREAFEREYLKVQIRRFSGNISRTASFIGMERSALHRKLKALGLSAATAEPSEPAAQPPAPVVTGPTGA